jgi:hypothetical protein
MSDEHDAVEGAEARDAAAEDAGGLGDADEERVRAVVEELRRLRVEDLALDMAVSLVTVGYQKLGLTDQTRELRDLDGARLAIELLRACLDVLERERGAAGLGDLRGTLAAMQLNYARVVTDETAEQRAGEEPAAQTAAASASGPETEPVAEPEEDATADAGASAGA